MESIADRKLEIQKILNYVQNKIKQNFELEISNISNEYVSNNTHISIKCNFDDKVVMLTVLNFLTRYMNNLKFRFCEIYLIGKRSSNYEQSCIITFFNY